MNKIFAVVCMGLLAMISGCGGSGGGSSMPATAVLTLSSQGSFPSGKAVAGFGAILELPAGVTVKTGAGGTVDVAAVAPSGLLGGSAGTMAPAIYTPATTAAKAKLEFVIASTVAAGVDIGEYATITLTLSGVNPAVTDFTVTSFTPVDLDGAALDGLTPKLNLRVF